MSEEKLLTDTEMAAILAKRPGSLASLACEGMYLTEEEHALVAQMDKERLPREARTKRIIAYMNSKFDQPAVAAE